MEEQEFNPAATVLSIEVFAGIFTNIGLINNKYFGVINVLLKTQDQWLFDNKNPYNGLLKVARLAGLSEEDVKLCLNSTELFNQIESNQRIATSRFGVNGTPSVFVNNKKISTLDFDTILAELNLSYE